MKNPIVPIIAVFCIVALGLVGYQAFRLFLVQDVALDTKSENDKVKTGNVFKDLVANHPKTEMQANKNKKFLQQSYNAVPFPHNITMGNPEAKIRLTVFSDIACYACRMRVSQVLSNVPLDDVYVVFKYAPLKQGDVKSGLFEQIAKRKDVLEKFQQRIYAQDENVSDVFMMQVLSELGISFKEQQMLIKDEPGGIVRELDKDLNQGNTVGLEVIPTFFLNRYRMGPQTLAVDKIGLYIERLKKNEPLYAESLLKK